MRPFAKYFANDFFVINLEVRGKGESGGGNKSLLDVNVDECRDVYETVEHIKLKYPNQTTEAVYINGVSGGGGRALPCLMKYPDYFAGASSFFGIYNYTQWYETTSEQDREAMRGRIGNVSYESRGAIVGIPYNFLEGVGIIIQHDPKDKNVAVEIAREFNKSYVESGGKDLLYLEV